MQEALVIISFALSITLLTRYLYRRNVASKRKCEGCGIHKMYVQKQGVK